MLTGIKLYAVGALLALVAGGGFIWHYTSLRSELSETRTELVEANVTIDTLEASIVAEREALAARDASVTIINKEEADGLIETEQALQANPEWSAEPVPSDVVSSLLE